MTEAPHHRYVHVPFCRLVCAYCDFGTVGRRAADIPRYVEALIAELEIRPRKRRAAGAPPNHDPLGS